MSISFGLLASTYDFINRNLIKRVRFGLRFKIYLGKYGRLYRRIFASGSKWCRVIRFIIFICINGRATSSGARAMSNGNRYDVFATKATSRILTNGWGFATVSEVIRRGVFVRDTINVVAPITRRILSGRAFFFYDNLRRAYQGGLINISVLRERERADTISCVGFLFRARFA